MSKEALKLLRCQEHLWNLLDSKSIVIKLPVDNRGLLPAIIIVRDCESYKSTYGHLFQVHLSLIGLTQQAGNYALAHSCELTTLEQLTPSILLS